MQPSVIVLRFMLVSGLGELVPIILDTSLACGLTVRTRANTIIDTVTYLVDETSGLWTVVLGGVPSHRGRARRRVVVTTARLYVLGIHTRPTVAWGPPPGGYRARSGSYQILVVSDTTSKGKGLSNSTLYLNKYHGTSI